MDTNEEVTIESEEKRILKGLYLLDIDTKEYSLALRNLKELEEARNIKKRQHPSPDTILIAITNILGIVLILKFEQLNVISSKAMSFVFRRS